MVKICYYFVNYIGFNMDNSITNDDLNNLENRLAVFNEYIYQNKANLINEYHSLLDEEFVSLENGIQLKTNWLTQNHPILEESLYKLQYSLQEKNVNFFSELMSTLTREILENDKTINFDLTIARSLPALRINAKTNENQSEDITSGALRNIISTGLRVLALWRLTTSDKRTSHRKFIVLDEPDASIANANVQKYAELLNQLSKFFKIQFVLITHKNSEIYSKFGRIYHFEKIDDSYINSNMVSDVEPYEDTDLNNYIKTLHLKNFKSSKDTIIELHPNLTVIIGKSDIGKSVIVESFDAIINNNSSDSLIRHYENKASISLDILDGGNLYNLLWERVSKTNTDFPQKVKYKLSKIIDENKPLEVLNEEFNSSKVPDFAIDILKMKKIDNIDVHISIQHVTDFLLSKSVTDQERAKILSLGKESSYVAKMMKLLKTKASDSKSEMNYEQKKYNKIKEIFDDKVIFKINENNENFKKIKQISVNELNFHNLILIDNEIKKMDYLEEIKQINPLKLIDKTNNLYDLDYLDLLGKKLNVLNFVSGIRQINEISKTNNKNVVKDLTEIDEYINILEFQNNNVNLKELNYINVNFKINPLDELENLGKKLKNQSIHYDLLISKLDELTKEKKLNDLEIVKLEEEVKVCPLCGNDLLHKH